MPKETSITTQQSLWVEDFDSFLGIYERYYGAMIPYGRMFGMSDRTARVFYLHSLMVLSLLQEPPLTDVNIKAYFYKDMKLSALRWKQCLIPPVFFFPWEILVDEEMGRGQRRSGPVTHNELVSGGLFQTPWALVRELMLEVFVLGHNQENVVQKLGIEPVKIRAALQVILRTAGLLLEYEVNGNV